MEVPAGIEPANKGFADPRLTTWPRHREADSSRLFFVLQHKNLGKRESLWSKDKK